MKRNIIAILIVCVGILQSPDATAFAPNTEVIQGAQFSDNVVKRFIGSTNPTAGSPDSAYIYWPFENNALSSGAAMLFTAIQSKRQTDNWVADGSAQFQAPAVINLCVDTTGGTIAGSDYVYIAKGVSPFDPSKLESSCRYIGAGAVDSGVKPVEIRVRLIASSVSSSDATVLDAYPLTGVIPLPSFAEAVSWEYQKVFMPFLLKKSGGVNDGYMYAEQKVTFFADNNVSHSSCVASSQTYTDITDATTVRSSACPKGDGMYDFDAVDSAKKLRVRPLNIGETDTVEAKKPNDLRLTVFNVGDGNCAVLQCPGSLGKAIILDCGSAADGYYTNAARSNNLVDTKVADILTSVASVDIIVSHPDLDHFNILAKALNNGSLLGNLIKDKLADTYLGGNLEWYENTDFKTQVKDLYTFANIEVDVASGAESITMPDTPGSRGGNLFVTELVKERAPPGAGMTRGSTVTKIIPAGEKIFAKRPPKRTASGDMKKSYKKYKSTPLYQTGNDGAGLPALACGSATVRITAANTPGQTSPIWAGNVGIGHDQVYSVGNEPGNAGGIYESEIVKLLSSSKKPGSVQSNTVSIVTHIEHQGKKILMPGDAGQLAMRVHFKNPNWVWDTDSYELVSLMHHGSEKKLHNKRIDDSFDVRDLLITRRLLSQNELQSTHDFPSIFAFQAHSKYNNTTAPGNFNSLATPPDSPAFDVDHLGGNVIANHIHVAESSPAPITHNLARWDKEREGAVMGVEETMQQEMYSTGDHGGIVFTLSGDTAAPQAFSGRCVGPFGGALLESLTATRDYFTAPLDTAKAELLRESLVDSAWCRE
jgi:beta-lactamase superfamily II metal-dependent hydrolase